MDSAAGRTGVSRQIMLVTLLPDERSIAVLPRWPYSSISVSQEILDRLLACNVALETHGIAIVITRGFEEHGGIRRIMRFIGKCIFLVIYFRRRNSIGCLFGPNGHDVPGACADLAIRVLGRQIILLPLGVFTPLWVLNMRLKKYADVLIQVHSCLKKQGFVLHDDPIEAAQIHCLT